MRSASFVLVFALALSSCGDTTEDPPLAGLKIQPPNDASCIGVSGFEIELSENGAAPRSFLSLRAAPVLDRDDCRIEQAATFSNLATDVPITVTIRGYDGAKQLRVQGSALLPSLHDADAISLVLEPAGVFASPVLTLDRAANVLAGRPLSAVSTLELSVPGQVKFDLPISTDNRPFFGVGEPWAVAFPGALADGDELTAKVTLDPGGVVNSKLVVTVAQGGDYFVAASPDPSHP